ncbi:MAG: sulfatase [Sedimentisphaerales bacterium]|nr:sulfatase [Sedimentisphaerales bacterium]
MNRRQFIKAIGAGAFLVTIPGCAKSVERTKGEAKKPSFVFFLVDDMGWTDAGCFGSSFYETPNIDRLAASGVRFTNAYAACPVCSPTRASIMTGKYPVRLATTDYFGAPQPDTVDRHWTKDKPLLPARYQDYLPHEEITVAEALKKAGYATFFAGKWHLGGEAYWPEHQGFDMNKGGHDRGGPYGGKKYFSPYGNPRLEDGPEGEHLPDRLATETVKFISDHKTDPFLAYLAFYSAHTPLMSREDLRQKYLSKKSRLGLEAQWGQEGDRKVRLVQEHAVYAGMIEAMDQAVGKVLDSIEASGLADNTVVIFMSDNGGLSTSEGHPTSNLPLRAGKGWLYEGGIREPMIIRWPGVAKAGSACDEPVISTDFYPTLLDMAGLPATPKQHIDGRSMAPLLTGKMKSLKREAIYWHYPHYGNQGGSPGSAIRAGDWKLIEFFEDNHVELYNLKKDISEQNNLAEKMPQKASQLRKMLHQWRKETGARMPTPNPNAKPKA